jgi:predicted metal-dependent hydrolase
MHPLLRFTLDLFESNQPLAHVNTAQDAIEKIAKKPPLPRAVKPKKVTPEAIANTAPRLFPANFRHPRASCEVRLGEALVAYEFKRGQRRSIGFSVGPQGLSVRAPKWTPLYEVDAALKTKADWILRKLQETLARHSRQTEQVMSWCDGASLLFLGQSVTLHLDPEHSFGAAGAQLMPATNASHNPQEPQPQRLHVALAHTASADQIREVVQAWLMRQAQQIFKARLDHFAPLLGVQWKKLSLSNAGTRWGSAKSDGSIRLNWRLVHYRMALLDYVVAHELSHLRVMDHSPRFWDTVRSVVPDYALLRQQLKAEASTVG